MIASFETKELVENLISSYTNFEKSPNTKNRWQLICSACLIHFYPSFLIHGMVLIGLDKVSVDMIHWVAEHSNVRSENIDKVQLNLWEELQMVIAIAIIADLFGPHNSFHKHDRDIERTALTLLNKFVMVIKKYQEILSALPTHKQIGTIRFASRTNKYHNLQYVLELLSRRDKSELQSSV